MRRFLLLTVVLSLGCLATVATRPRAADPEPVPGEPPEAEPEDPGDGKALQLVLDTGGHTAHVTQLLFTPDGKEAITMSLDKTIRVWDLATGQTSRVLRPPSTTGDPGNLLAAALSPDGKVLAVSGVVLHGQQTAHQIHLIRLSDALIERTLDQAADGVALAFSPDGTRLAATAPGEKPAVRVWDAATGKVVRDLEIPAGPVGSVAFSPDGRFLAAGSGKYKGQVRVWDVGTGMPEHDFELRGPVPGVAWSPDGRQLAAAGHDGTVLLNRDLTRVWHHPERGRFVAFTPDGGQLLHVSGPPGNTVTRHDLATRKELSGFIPGIPAGDRLTGGALSADGKWVAAIGNRPGDVYVWSTADGTLECRLAGKGENVAGVAWTGARNTVAWNTRPVAKAGKAESGGSGRRPAAGRPRRPAGKVEKAEKAEVDFTRSFHLDSLEFGPAVDGKDAVGFQHQLDRFTLERVPTVKAVRMVTRRQVHNLQPFKPIEAFTFVGESRAALACESGSLWLTGSRGGQPLRQLVGHATVVKSLAARPSGGYLLSAGTDETIRVWNPDQDRTAERGKPLYPLVSLLIAGNDWVVWTPEGYYAASPGGEKLVGWVTDNGPDRMMTFYPAERFRKRLYRPDIIKLALEKGSVAEALKVAKIEVPDVEKLLPPRATLQIVDRTALPKLKVKASAEAAVKGQPVASLRLLVDGRPLPEGGVLDLKAAQAKAEAEWEVTLPPGEHELKVLARGPDTAGASEAVAVTVPPPANVPAKAGPTLHLLAVGINEYQDKNLRLKFAANDARDLAKAFRERCAGAGNVFGAVQGGDPLLDAEATRQGVLDAIGAIRRGVKPSDLVVVYFAGHGVKEQDDFYLLTVEADTTKLAQTALSGKELRKQLADIPCQVLLILDACHSAAGVKAFKRANDDAARTLTDDECAVAVLCAAMGEEYAQEANGNGLFTRALVDALKGADVPYNHRDHRQYVHDLYKFVLEEVQADSDDQQHPFLNLPWVTRPFAVRRVPGG
jgi:WD40 repeat protein